MTVKMAVIDRVRDTGSCGQASSAVIESETDGCNEVTLKVTERDISSHRYA